MQFNWFKIFNRNEFDADALVSQEYTYTLDQIGEKTFLVTQGNLLSVTLDGVMLSLGLGVDIPFEFEGFALYQDANADVWWGFPVET